MQNKKEYNPSGGVNSVLSISSHDIKQTPRQLIKEVADNRGLVGSRFHMGGNRKV